MPGFPPDPLRVICDTCGAEGFTFDYQHPDRAVDCGCCPLPHDHAGLSCRTVTICATARLAAFSAGDLLDAAGEVPAGERAVDAAGLLLLVHPVAAGPRPARRACAGRGAGVDGTG